MAAAVWKSGVTSGDVPFDVIGDVGECKGDVDALPKAVEAEGEK